MDGLSDLENKYEIKSVLKTSTHTLISVELAPPKNEIRYEQLLRLFLKFEENGEKEKRYWLKSTMKQTNNGEEISIGTDFDYTDELFKHTLPVFESSPSFLIRFLEKTVDIKVILLPRLEHYSLRWGL